MLYPWANGELAQITHERIGRKLVSAAQSILSRLHASINERDAEKIIVKL